MEQRIETLNERTVPGQIICGNTGFQWRVFSHIKKEFTILSLYGRIRVSKNPYCRIIYAVTLSYIFTAWKVSKYEVISGLCYPAFGLNTERYFVFGHFSRSDCNTQSRIVKLWVSPSERPIRKEKWKRHPRKRSIGVSLFNLT